MKWSIFFRKVKSTEELENLFLNIFATDSKKEEIFKKRKKIGKRWRWRFNRLSIGQYLKVLGLNPVDNRDFLTWGCLPNNFFLRIHFDRCFRVSLARGLVFLWTQLILQNVSEFSTPNTSTISIIRYEMSASGCWALVVEHVGSSLAGLFLLLSLFSYLLSSVFYLVAQGELLSFIGLVKAIHEWMPT